MPSVRNEQVITLVGGPYDRQAFYRSDWDQFREAAQRFERTPDDVRGWVLGYRPETPSSPRWVWTR